MHVLCVSRHSLHGRVLSCALVKSTCCYLDKAEIWLPGSPLERLQCAPCLFLMVPLCSQDKEQTPDDLRRFPYPGPCQPLSLALLCPSHIDLLYTPRKCNPSSCKAFTEAASPFFPHLICLLNFSQLTSLGKTFLTLQTRSGLLTMLLHLSLSLLCNYSCNDLYCLRQQGQEVRTCALFDYHWFPGLNTKHFWEAGPFEKLKTFVE